MVHVTLPKVFFEQVFIGGDELTLLILLYILGPGLLVNEILLIFFIVMEPPDTFQDYVELIYLRSILVVSLIDQKEIPMQLYVVLINFVMGVTWLSVRVILASLLRFVRILCSFACWLVIPCLFGSSSTASSHSFGIFGLVMNILVVITISVILLVIIISRELFIFNVAGVCRLQILLVVPELLSLFDLSATNSTHKLLINLKISPLILAKLMAISQLLPPDSIQPRLLKPISLLVDNRRLLNLCHLLANLVIRSVLVFSLLFPRHGLSVQCLHLPEPYLLLLLKLLLESLHQELVLVKILKDTGAVRDLVLRSVLRALDNLRELKHEELDLRNVATDHLEVSK